MTTWKVLIVEEMTKHHDRWDEIVETIPPIEETPWYDIEFNNSRYGSQEGDSFVVWTENYVYFPIIYDGYEWVGCVPRNPEKDWKVEHFGGS